MVIEKFEDKIQKTILGEYAPGGIPTVYSDVHSSAESFNATIAHETAHMDLLSNSVYGQVLIVLCHLSKNNSNEIIGFQKKYAELCRRVFDIVEGEAVALEAIHHILRCVVKGEKEFNFDKFLLTKPEEYKIASEYFLRTILTMQTYNLGVFAYRTIIQTIASICIDSQFFQNYKYPDTLPGLLNFLENGDYSRNKIQEICLAFFSIPIEKIESAINIKDLYTYEKRTAHHDTSLRLIKLFIEQNNFEVDYHFFSNDRRMEYLSEIFKEYENVIFSKELKSSRNLRIKQKTKNNKTVAHGLRNITELINFIDGMAKANESEGDEKCSILQIPFLISDLKNDTYTVTSHFSYWRKDNSIAYDNNVVIVDNIPIFDIKPFSNSYCSAIVMLFNDFEIRQSFFKEWFNNDFKVPLFLFTDNFSPEFFHQLKNNNFGDISSLDFVRLDKMDVLLFVEYENYTIFCPVYSEGLDNYSYLFGNGIELKNESSHPLFVSVFYLYLSTLINLY